MVILTHALHFALSALITRLHFVIDREAEIFEAIAAVLFGEEFAVLVGARVGERHERTGNRLARIIGDDTGKDARGGRFLLLLNQRALVIDFGGRTVAGIEIGRGILRAGRSQACYVCGGYKEQILAHNLSGIVSILPHVIPPRSSTFL